MGYKNAESVIPIELLREIQKHIDGEYIYIPKKTENKKLWGEETGTKSILSARNRIIAGQYASGISVNKLACDYFLSPKTVYKILSEMRKKQ